jgi:serine/threonine protein kinase/tetratricopeptide (TPR) repeat protein
MNEPVTAPYEPDESLSPNVASGQALASTIVESGATPAAGSASPQRGKFRIVKEHARGGLGKVSVAIDARLKRNVALKEIRPDRLDNPQVRQRFITEAEITGLLEHPGIVPIYSFEEDADGQPYYAMRFIQGRTLGEAIGAYHRQPDPLAFRALLQRFGSVCQTMAYAHSKGVIHRDLKPANIMLGEYGETLVLDWGLAKRVEWEGGAPDEPDGERGSAGASPSRSGDSSTQEDLLTQAGQILGTPAYMAPEQARGEDVGRAGDVYALGAILYEMLTGRAAYAGASAAELLAQVRAGSPIDPAIVQKKAARPLAAICRRAMARDTADRYTAAADVALEVDRWLADEPVAAYREPWAVKAGRWIKRHKPLVTGAAALLLAAVPLLLLLAANREQARKQSEADKVEIGKQRDIAEANEKTAKENDAIQRAVIDFVENRVFAAARPKNQEGGLGYDVKLKDALLAALPYVENSSLKDQPLVEARLRATLGRSFAFLGDGKIAGEQFQAARVIYTMHKGPDDPEALALTADVASSYDMQGRYAEALELREKTVAQMQAALGRDHWKTLSGTSNLVLSYYRVERYAEAVQLGEETLTLAKRARGPNDRITLGCMHNLAISYAALGRDADAVKLYEEALLLEKLNGGTDHPDTLLTADAMAQSYEALGRHEEALKLKEDTLTRRKAVLGPDHPASLMSMHNLAVSYAALGRHADALKLREEALVLRKAKLGAEHPNTVMSLWGVAATYADLGRHAEALPLFNETLELLKKKLPPAHPHMFVLKADLAMCLVNLDRGAEAMPLIDECVKHAAGRDLRPGFNANMLNLRLRYFQKAKDSAGCRATAEVWERLGRTDAESLYNAACMRAVTAAVIRAVDKSEGTRNAAAAEADRAMAWLKRAITVGYKDVGHIKQDNDLNALREREDFKMLVSQSQATIEMKDAGRLNESK